MGTQKRHCSLCNHFAAPNFLGVLKKHIGQVHQFEPSFEVKCGLDGCALRDRAYELFRVHVYKRHRDVLFSDRGDDIVCDRKDSDDTPNSPQTFQE